MNIPEENIILIGRSIGTGPATFIASISKPGVLILISPFTSLKAAVSDLYGFLAASLLK